MKELSRLQAPDILHGSGPSHRRTELAHFLSDWHLIAFLGTTQLVSQEDMNVLLRVASSPNLEDPAVTDALFKTESWETLMTFTREMAREFNSALARYSLRGTNASLLAAPTSGQTVGAPASHDVDDFSEELLARISREDAAGGSGGGSGGASNIRICPHCTFENTHGGSDCEVCGLPL